MKNIKLLSSFSLMVLLMSSCALNKMIKLAKDQQLEVAPNPLEVHANKVTYEMSAVLPSKMLPKGKAYSVKNLYAYDDKEMEVGSVDFSAGDFPNSSTTTSRLSKEFSFPYKAELNPGKVYVQGVATNPANGKTKTTDKLPVADGIITTSLLVQPVSFSSYADHGYNDKEELIPTNVDFFFDQGRSTLKSSERRGSRGTKLSAFIADKNVTKTVTITGTHSPEGLERINAGLSNDRAKAIETFYRKEMKKYDYKDVSDQISFILKPVVEDWTAFKTALASYDGVSESVKAEMTGIVNGTGSFEQKEKALRKVSGYKSVFRDIYPSLRAAKTEILTVKPKKSNAEITILSKAISNGSLPADTLSMEELMFSATLTPTLKEKEAVYTACTKKATSSAAHNNLGAVYLAQAQAASGQSRASLIEKAVTQLEIASKISNSAEVQANLGSAYALQGNYAAAYETLSAVKGSSQKMTNNINAVKGSIEIRNAEYGKAVGTLANVTGAEASFNKGLALLLNKEYANAITTLSKVTDANPNHGLAHYVKGVAAARLNQESVVVSSLKSAVAADASLKEKALNDLEFRNFTSQVAEAVK